MTISKLDIEEFRKKNGLTQKQLAEMLGVDRKTIINYEGGKPIPETKVELFVKLFDMYKKGTESGGKLDKQSLGQIQNQSQRIGEIDQFSSIPTFEPIFPYRSEGKNFQKPGEIEYINLPFVSVPARASFAEVGDGVNVDMYETIPVIKLPGENYTGSVIFEIDGDSMEPSYLSGTRVRAKPIPLSQWPYLSSAIYGIAVGGSFLVKRIKNNDYQSGYLVLHSDNENTGGMLKVRTQDIRSVWRIMDTVWAPPRP